MSEWSKILKFNDKYFPEWRKRDPLYYSNAILGELGEVANALKKAIGGGTHRTKTKDEYIGDVQEELADVYIYLVMYAERMGMNEETFNKMISAKVGVIERRMTSRIKRKLRKLKK
jgi:NTP pyrophosphatase (non-canonical NTP hydrolase)